MKPYYDRDGITIYNDDCREILPTLDKVDLLVNDPPFFKVKGDWWDNQWDKPECFLKWIGELCDQWKLILKPNGSLYCFASPQMSWGVEGEIRKRFNVLTNIRWRKPPFSTKAEMFDKDDLRSPFPASETIIFAEQLGSDENAMSDAGYLSACESTKKEIIGDYLRAEFNRAGVTNKAIAELFPSNTGGLTGCVSNWLLGANVPTPDQYDTMRSHLNSLSGREYLKREYEYLKREYEDLKREYEDQRRPFNASECRPYTDVWDFETVSAHARSKHPCQKPLGLMEHIVETSSRTGDTVLDCFGGSFRIAEACQNFGRKFIGIEISEKYCEIAANRLAQGVLDFGKVESAGII